MAMLFQHRGILMSRLFLLVAGSVLSIIVGCGGGTPPTAPPGRFPVFEDFGIYSLPDSEDSLNISSNGELVDFKLTDPTGKALITSDIRPSVHQRWVFSWDAATKTLWFSSSDIGTFGWFRGPDGMFRKKKLTDMSAAERNTAPQEFRNRLSSVVQDLFRE